MQRAGAMNLLSFLLNDMTEENRKLKLIIFPGETVVIDEHDIDETEQGRYCYCKSGVSK